MRPVFRYSLLALPALMVACASEPPPPAPRPAAPALQAPTPAPSAINAAPPGLDGRWNGQARLEANQGAECRRATMPAAMTVNGGRAALTFGRGQTLEGTITSDGMVRFANGDMAANGTFQARRMTGDASREGCTYALSLRKR
jgi:hypothetical protein